MANEQFFSPRMKMAALIQLDYRLLFLLPRFGIGLGFGERSVAEVCLEAGVAPDLFMLICSIYTTDPDQLPDDFPADSVDLGGLVRYLHNSHGYYTGERLGTLGQMFTQAVSSLSGKSRQTLEKFYDDYCHELIAHFDYEEKTLFPYVLAVAQGRTTGGYSIAEFEKNHSNIEDKLEDLTNIIIKYLPHSPAPSGAVRLPAGSALLVELFRLGDDLMRHTYIEDHILAPVVAKLENR